MDATKADHTMKVDVSKYLEDNDQPADRTMQVDTDDLLSGKDQADALRRADDELSAASERTMKVDLDDLRDDDPARTLRQADEELNAGAPDRTMQIDMDAFADEEDDPAHMLQKADQELYGGPGDRTMQIDVDAFEEEDEPPRRPSVKKVNPAQLAETITAPDTTGPFDRFRLSDVTTREFWAALDTVIAGWMARNGTGLLRWTLGIIFIWFGALKPLGLSPAQELVSNTVYWVDPAWFVPLLGYWEVLIGIGLLIKPLIRPAIALLFLQMPGTFMPLILLPDVCFTRFPIGLTLEGQYIVKNLVLIAAALVVGGTVRDHASAAK